MVLEALHRFGGPVCFLDSDSIVKPGFPAEVAAKLAPQEVWSVTKTAVVMNRFELRDPFPPLKGFRTTLPHAGYYYYDTANSWMFNSGLIGASRIRVPREGCGSSILRAWSCSFRPSEWAAAASSLYLGSPRIE